MTERFMSCTDLLFSALSAFDVYICFRIRSYFKRHGVLPNEGAPKPLGSV